MRYLERFFEVMVQAIGVTFSIYVIIYIMLTRFNPFSFNAADLMVSLSISIVWTGIVAGLQYKRFGTWVSWLGVVLFMLTMYWVSGHWPSGWLLGVLALPGLLYIICHYFKSNLQKT
jgi:hypothetical protein